MEDYTLSGQFEYDGLLLSNRVSSARLIDGARQLRLTTTDTIVATYTKSGTTWMKYLAYLVMNNGHDVGVASKATISDVRYLEMKTAQESEDEVLKMLAEKAPPRLFVTHLPFRLLKKQVIEDKVNVIVVMRNPKDTLVSFYHFYRMNKAMGFFSGTWGDFFQLFKLKRVFSGDFFDHNIEWWNVRDYDNVLVVFYEEMKADLEGVVRTVAKFMGYKLSDDVIQKIVHLSSFKQMKDNPRLNGAGAAKIGFLDFTKSQLMRKGEVGDWKNYFSEEQSKYIDALCAERCTPLGLTFLEH